LLALDSSSDRPGQNSGAIGGSRGTVAEPFLGVNLINVAAYSKRLQTDTVSGPPGLGTAVPWEDVEHARRIPVWANPELRTLWRLWSWHLEGRQWLPPTDDQFKVSLFHGSVGLLLR